MVDSPGSSVAYLSTGHGGGTRRMIPSVRNQAGVSPGHTVAPTHTSTRHTHTPGSHYDPTLQQHRRNPWHCAADLAICIILAAFSFLRSLHPGSASNSISSRVFFFDLIRRFSIGSGVQIFRIISGSSGILTPPLHSTYGRPFRFR